MSILFAILAKDKGHCLSFYLHCLYNQTFPKDKTHLYIRTNDNNDDTCEVLQKFIEKHGTEYASVFYDDSSINETLKTYKQHEWNCTRFTILGKIRQDSIAYAQKLGADYFVADCDNFLVPTAVETLYQNRHFGVIAPMLVTKNTYYSNYHYEIDANGYLQSNSPLYHDLLCRRIKGLSAVKVVHCTYFINVNLLDKISYDDASYRYEYVIFSDVLRKQNIDQYLDNRQFYGFIVFSETTAEIKTELEEKWVDTIRESFVPYTLPLPLVETLPLVDPLD